MRHVLTTAFLCLSLSGPALADRVTAGDGSSLMRWYLEENAQVEPLIDDWGDPLLDVEQYGQSFQVFYYGCTDGRDCDAIQFYSGYRTNGAVRQSTINEWNAGKRFLRAYLSDEGNARIEYDVMLGAEGLSGDDFVKVNGIWLNGMREFEAHIGW